MATSPTTSGSGHTASEAEHRTGSRSRRDTDDTDTHTEAAPAPPPPPDPAVLAAQKEAMAASSIGAQIILDFNEDGSIGARGGAGADMVENTMARDAHLVALGLDPNAPSGPPPSPPVLKARQDAAEKAAKEASDPQFMPAQSGKATRVSSLAAGISGEDLPPPTVAGASSSGTTKAG
jgi:hypothetical protein